MIETENFELKLKRAFEYFKESDRYFVNGKTGYKDIAKNACSILSDYKNISGPICICTDDRGLILSAVAASLCGGPELMLPHSFSLNALTDMKNIFDFKYALTDAAMELPEGVKPVILGNGNITELAFKKNPDDIFLRLFTGGSTGNPKLWEKSVRNLLGEAFFLSENFGMTGSDVFLSSVPAFHIYGLLFSILVPFVSGASVLSATPLFPNEIIKYIIEGKPSILISVPPHYRALNGSEIKKYSLRLAFSSAGSLNQNDAAYFADKTGIEVNEIYGSTETGGIATRKISDGTDFSVFSGIEFSVKDERLLVKSEFISQSLPVDEDGFFLTGDRVELLYNGKFMLLGRADGIVKVGGRRVDLAEIQNRIKKIPGVKDAVVVSVPVPGGRENVISALIEGDIDVQTIRNALMSQLEPYAVPKKIKVVEKIPLTSAGKYNKTEIDKLL